MGFKAFIRLWTASAVLAASLGGAAMPALAIDNGQAAIDELGQLNSSDQPVFTKNGVNNSLNNRTLNTNEAVAIDTTTHRLFVADYNGNRVLVYNLGASNNIVSRAAVNVLGQPNFDFDSSGAPTNVTQSGIYRPYALLFDAARSRLFVAEFGNNRVSVFNAGTITNNMPAAFVLGQPDFTTNAAATTQSGMNGPKGLGYDPVNSRLFVSDNTNRRLLVFNAAALSNGMNAANVLGQASYTSAAGLGATQNSLSAPTGIAYDSANSRLFVADKLFRSRVLMFNLASGITDFMGATSVLGQTSFTATSCSTSQSRLCSPDGVAYDSVKGLFVAASGTVRVFTAAKVAPGFANGVAADFVLGSPNFTTAGNSGNSTQSGLYTPTGVSYDSTSSNLYVNDDYFSRLMVWNVASISNGMNASDALGAINYLDQPAFSKTFSDATNSRGLYTPWSSSAVDTVNHRLFVADYSNMRVLVYNLTSTDTLSSHVPSNVLGSLCTACSGTAGLTSFDSRSVPNPPNQSSLSFPQGVAYDSANNRLFVVDTGNQRVMVYGVATITNGMNASNVLGQGGFGTNAASLSQSGMSGPRAAAYDSVNNRLFVADQGNNRVLVFNGAAISNGMNASSVLGQPDFTSSAAGVTQSGLSGPQSVAYSTSTVKLFVGDTGASRVLVFNAGSITSGMAAANVLGQPDFTSSAGGVTQSQMSPYGLAYDPAYNRLFVADNYANRVLMFLVGTMTDGMPATSVLGQPDFVSSGAAATQSGLNYAVGVAYAHTSKNLFVNEANNNRVSVFFASTGTTGCTYNPPNSFVFTDAVLTPHQSVARAVYVNELRAAINTLRVNAGLTAQTWTDVQPISSNASVIRAVYISEMRTALNAVYTACGQSTPTYTDPTLTPNATIIVAPHIQELRTAVNGAK